MSSQTGSPHGRMDHTSHSDTLLYPTEWTRACARGQSRLPMQSRSTADHLQVPPALSHRAALLIAVISVCSIVLTGCGRSESDEELCLDLRDQSAQSLPEAVTSNHVAACHRLADTGNSSAYLLLGTMYELGAGVTADAAKALELYSKAAVQLPDRAEFNIGMLYLSGPTGVPRDSRKALEHLERGLAAGSREAEASIGAMYYYGDEAVPRNLDKALRHLENASTAGDPYAKMVLGAALTDNEGVAPNPVRARHLMQEATDSANRAPPMAFVLLGDFLVNGGGGAVDLPAARKAYLKAKELGAPDVDARLSQLKAQEDRASPAKTPGAKKASLKQIFDTSASPEDRKRMAESFVPGDWHVFELTGHANYSFRADGTWSASKCMVWGEVSERQYEGGYGGNWDVTEMRYANTGKIYFAISLHESEYATTDFVIDRDGGFQEYFGGDGLRKMQRGHRRDCPDNP